MSMETMSFPDKLKRDEVFQDLRANGDELERQVVRFSGCEKIGEKRIYRNPGQLDGPYEIRSIYKSVWILAYPRS